MQLTMTRQTKQLDVHLTNHPGTSAVGGISSPGLSLGLLMHATSFSPNSIIIRMEADI